MKFFRALALFFFLPLSAALAQWTPATPTNTLTEWLKADALALSNNTVFSPWTATVGKDAASSGSARPTFLTNQRNGLPVVRFDGVANYMATAAFTSAQAQPCTLLVAYRLTANYGATFGKIVDGITSGNRLMFEPNATGSGGKLGVYAGTAEIATTTAADQVWHVAIVEFNQAATKVAIDNGAFTTVSSTPGANTITGLTLAANFNTTVQFTSIDIGEVILWNGTLSSGDKASAQNYAVARWVTHTPTTVNAASCSDVDVGAAFASSDDGDTVVIPACAGGVTWTTAPPLISHAITLQGAGIGQTIIRDGVAAGPLLNWILVAGKPSRMTGIEFQNGGRSSTAVAPSGLIHVTGSNTNGSTFRWDHCKWVSLNGYPVFDTVIGAIDHMDITFGAIWIYIYDNFWNGHEYGDGAWADTSHWGSDRFLFMESNTATCTSGSIIGAFTDSFGGGRFVVRNNILNNCSVQNHGTESGQRARGGRAIEIYGNTFTGSNINNFLTDIRSGTALIHDNTATGYQSPGTRFFTNNHRTFNKFTPWAGSDGTSIWDVDNVGGVFYSGTASGASSSFTVTVSGSPGWSTANGGQWSGYVLNRTASATRNVPLSVSSITSSGTTATVTMTGHPFATGNYALIAGAAQPEYNGNYIVTVTGANTFTYSFLGSVTTPATGSLTATMPDPGFGEIEASGSNTLTFTSNGGYSNNNFSFGAGDSFEIRKVNQALDQPGRSGGTLIADTSPGSAVPVPWSANDQITDPMIAWSNTREGGGNINFSPGVKIIRASEHYFDSTTSPVGAPPAGYTPYIFPHPLVTGGPAPGPAIIRIK